MVLSALRLLFGGRADQGLAASKETSVQGGWGNAIRQSDFAQRMADAGCHFQTANCCSRGRCQARAAADVLRMARLCPSRSSPILLDDLVAVHGQSDQTLLRRGSRQRDVLDRFGGARLAKLRDDYTAKYTVVKELDALFVEASTRHQGAGRRACHPCAINSKRSIECHPLRVKMLRSERQRIGSRICPNCRLLQL